MPRSHFIEKSHDEALHRALLAFEIKTKGAAGYLNNISAAIHKQALKQNVLIRPLGNTIYIMPPYCITEEQLQHVYSVIESILVNT